ncbi:hypothetical protein C0J52_19184 [Blattella germanica]|nr:hypothetical protein C0J52_19184 [Blattella germanica]
MLSRFFWTQNRNWTGMSSNSSESRKFRNVSATKKSRRRRFYVVYPTVLSLSSPSFVPQLYHLRPKTLLNILRRPGFKMQKRKKKHRYFDGRNCLRSLQIPVNMQL